MEGIIKNKFEQWTSSVPDEKKHKAVFEQIRDIPYRIVPTFFDPATGPSAMLESGKGFCAPKHYLLAIMFAELGIPVRYFIYSFKWKDVKAEYPARLRDAAARLKTSFHLACRAYIGGVWVLTDATWDRGLKPAGFPVNDPWDGRTDTELAVPFIEEYQCRCPEEYRKKLNGYTLPERLSFQRFSIDFNKWLDGIRN